MKAQMNQILHTERLRLREFNTGDTAFIVDLLNSPGWLQFIGDRNVRTEADAKTYLESGPLKSYAQNGYGLWMVERGEDGAPAGMCGLVKRDYLDRPDIGFALMPGFQGKGYAYEAAKATLDHALSRLGLPGVHAITLPENRSSIRLLERLGLRFADNILPPGSQETLLLYSLDR